MKSKLLTSIVGIMVVAVAAYAAEISDYTWLNGKWKSDSGTFAVIFKVSGSTVEGETISPAPRNRTISGTIKNFKAEGETITFQAVYEIGHRRVGPPTQINRYELRRISPSRMEGGMTRDDGSKREMILEKESE